MKAYVRAPYSEDCLQELRQMFDEVVYEPWTATGERYYEDEMLENLRRVQPDVLITELDRVTEKVLSGYDGLRVIGDCRGTPANLDVEACTRHGVPILCTPGRNTQAVAEMVVGLILTVMRKTIPATQWVKDGKWVTGTTPYYLWMGNELHPVRLLPPGKKERRQHRRLTPHSPAGAGLPALPRSRSGSRRLFQRADHGFHHIPSSHRERWARRSGFRSS